MSVIQIDHRLVVQDPVLLLHGATQARAERELIDGILHAGRNQL